MTTTKAIYKLKLHEATTTPELIKGANLKYIVTRVAGGWLYESTCEDGSLVFVPYCEEMKNQMDGVVT